MRHNSAQVWLQVGTEAQEEKLPTPEQAQLCLRGVPGGKDWWASTLCPGAGAAAVSRAPCAQGQERPCVRTAAGKSRRNH